MSEAKEAVEQRTDEAFAASRWVDPRGDYRATLRALRESDTVAFDEAVREYEARVVTRVAESAVDPVAAWIDFGLRLAQLAGRGRTMRIDEEGRATDFDHAGIDAGPMLLLHLPADESTSAFVVAAPREPTPAQHAAIALLAAGAQGLSL